MESHECHAISDKDSEYVNVDAISRVPTTANTVNRPHLAILHSGASRHLSVVKDRDIGPLQH